MALIFPISASVGQTYQTGSSNTYEWTGEYWKIKNVINFNAFSASISQRVTDGISEQDLSSFATTGSNTFIGNQIISGSLLIDGSGSLNGNFLVSSNTIQLIETISSASYAELSPPVSGTLYIII